MEQEVGALNVDLNGASWRTSSYSGGNGGQCVAVAAVSWQGRGQDGLCLVRDSKNPNGTVLAFDRQSWSEFTTDVKTGRFDSIGADRCGALPSSYRRSSGRIIW